MKREDVLLLVENLRKLCVIVTGIADVMEKLAVEHQIKCTKKIKLNAKRNNVKFNSIQII